MIRKINTLCVHEKQFSFLINSVCTKIYNKKLKENQEKCVYLYTHVRFLFNKLKYLFYAAEFMNVI